MPTTIPDRLRGNVFGKKTSITFETEEAAIAWGRAHMENATRPPTLVVAVQRFDGDTFWTALHIRPGQNPTHRDGPYHTFQWEPHWTVVVREPGKVRPLLKGFDGEVDARAYAATRTDAQHISVLHTVEVGKSSTVACWRPERGWYQPR